MHCCCTPARTQKICSCELYRRRTRLTKHKHIHIKAQASISWNLPSYTRRCRNGWKGQIVNRVTDVERGTLKLAETRKCWNKPFQTSVTSFISVGKSGKVSWNFSFFGYGLARSWLNCLHKLLPIFFSEFFFSISIFLFFILVAQRLRVNLTPVLSPYMYKLATYVKTLNSYSLFYFILLPREFVTSMTDRTGFWRKSSFSFSVGIRDSCHQSTAWMKCNCNY